MLKTVLLSAFTLAAAFSAIAQDYLDRSAWKWTASSVCAAEGNDIIGLEGICDGDLQTCWHSNWHAADGTPERSNPHWIMIDRGADRTEFTGLAYTPRQATANQACTSYYVYLSDTDLSSAPATSATDIVTALGDPDASGSWEGSTTEKFVTFQSASTARYILFVNLSSLSSSSAACAEMNLIGNGGVASGTFNAIRITPTNGNTPHRIATRGSELSLSMNFGYIRLSNSEITIEYAPNEVSRFTLEQYDFGDNAYEGPKKDIHSSTFALGITPAGGELIDNTLSQITISPAGALQTRINPEITENISFTGNGTPLRTIAPDELPSLAVGTDYVISGLTATAPGNYTLTIPADLLIEPDGSRSEAVEMAWTIKDPDAGQDAIESVETVCPTLTFSHSGGNLTVGGITAVSTVTLIDASGRSVMTAKVSSDGSATFAVGSLPHGVYLLKVNQTTLKIIL